MAISDEVKLDKELLNENPERKIINEPGDSDWGQLIIPGNNENPDKTNEGLRLLLISSYRIGYVLVKALIDYEERYPDKLNIVGLITDDPVSPHARISMKRRIWRLFDDQQKFDIEDAIVELALKAAIPVYTGSVKTNYGHLLLEKWNPDAIEVCVFGQIIDSAFINYPKFGIYNFHPADLKNNFGAGPQPFQDLINRDASYSKVTVHQLSEQLDSGHIIGQSPNINVRNTDGSITYNILILEDKVTEPIDFMAVIFTYHLIKKKETNDVGKLESLNFSKHFTKAHKDLLLNPITASKPCNSMPETSAFTAQFISKIS